MKWIITVLVAITVPVALIALAWHMMDIHQQGAGWVILAAIVITGGISIKFKD